MTTAANRQPAGPLSGVTVLDLCSYLAGPYGCTLLADLGADVIKIESPQGDMLRQFPSSLDGESRFFLGTNRGKRALALDLKQKEGLAVLHCTAWSSAPMYWWRISARRCRPGSASTTRDSGRSIRVSSMPG
jgi:crotonobetainyl-CoA:carnitine CoA-transferase CaiB-like acyl-CoA transferase